MFRGGWRSSSWQYRKDDRTPWGIPRGLGLVVGIQDWVPGSARNWSARDTKAQATPTSCLLQQWDALVVQAQIVRLVPVTIPSQCAFWRNSPNSLFSQVRTRAKVRGKQCLLLPLESRKGNDWKKNTKNDLKKLFLFTLHLKNYFYPFLKSVSVISF